MVGKLFTFIIEMAPFYLLRLFTRGGWVVKKDQNSVYLVIEWPLKYDALTCMSFSCGELKYKI